MSTSTRGSATTASSGRGASHPRMTPAGVATLASRRATNHGCREINGSEKFISSVELCGCCLKDKNDE